MHGSTARKLVLVPALAVAWLVAVAPIASAKVDPQPTGTSVAPATTVVEDPPPSTVSGDPAEPAAELEAAKIGDPVPATTVPQSIVPIGPIGPGGPSVEPDPQPNPQITVTPNEDLQHLQTVQISGTGFSPDHQVGAAQCKAGATDVNGCDIGRSVITSTDGDGAWSGSLVVSARIRVAGEVIDCTTAAGACFLGAARIYDYKEGVFVPLAFDPDAVVPPPPAVTVTPSADLVHDQSVTVNVSGLAPNDPVQIIECAPGGQYPVCSYSLGAILEHQADSTGNLTTPFTVQRVIGNGGGLIVDCAEDNECYIEVTSFTDQLATGRAAITFDPDAPLPPRPVVNVDPSTDLVHNQLLEITGSGFDPNEDVQVSQCSVNSDPYPVCSYGYGFFPPGFQPPVDANGNLKVTFTARRLVGYPGPGGVVVDCAESPGCLIRVFSYNNALHSADAPISFDPDVPLPPPPSLTIDPDTDLVHNQTLTVSGSGYVPNDFIELYECLEDENGLTRSCAYSRGGAVQSDEKGEFTTTFIAKRVLGYPGEPLLDCLEAAECALYAQSFSDPFASAEHELHFDPDAPLPPPPTLTIDPSTDLPSRKSVHVTGSGFAPDTFHNVVQCSQDSNLFDSRCNYGPSVQSDENGEIDARFTVRRFVPSFPEPIDCADTDRCVVAAYSYEDPLSVASTPVSFDPNAPPPPQPSITVSPADGLSDGASVTVTGKDFSPLATIAMSQCRSDAQPVNCDITIVKFVTTDENGTFTTDYKVLSNIQVFDGPVACESSPGACSFQALNVGDSEEATPKVALTFGPKVSDPLIGVGGGDPGAPSTPISPVLVTVAPRLAFTGTPVAEYLEFGAISLGLGVLLVLAGRKRRVRVELPLVLERQDLVRHGLELVAP